MSYQTWHNYGYGICTNSLEDADVSRIWMLLHMAPEFEAKVLAEFEEDETTELTTEDFQELECAGCYGIASIMEEVIREAEHLSFCACDDYDNNRYLLYMPSYPWELHQDEQALTEEDIRLIFVKYVNILTDEVLDVEYQAVENGG